MTMVGDTRRSPIGRMGVNHVKTPRTKRKERKTRTYKSRVRTAAKARGVRKLDIRPGSLQLETKECKVESAIRASRNQKRGGERSSNT